MNFFSNNDDPITSQNIDVSSSFILCINLHINKQNNMEYIA